MKRRRGRFDPVAVRGARSRKQHGGILAAWWSDCSHGAQAFAHFSLMVLKTQAVTHPFLAGVGIF